MRRELEQFGTNVPLNFRQAVPAITRGSLISNLVPFEPNKGVHLQRQFPPCLPTQH